MLSLKPHGPVCSFKCRHRFLCNALRRFSFCQSVFGNSSPITSPATWTSRKASHVTTDSDRQMLHWMRPKPQTTGPIANRLTGCSVRLQSWLAQEYTKYLYSAELGPNSETTSWLRFVCQLTVSRPVNSLCKVLFQLSLTVLVCYRCRSRIA